MNIAAIFSNHCVLQRDKVISIFGTAENGISVQVTLLNSKNETLSTGIAITANSKWLVKLSPQPAQTACTLQITATDNSAVTFTDIAIGEVWLAGGQSNMEFELGNCTEGPDELKSPDAGKNVRFYYTNKIAWKDEHFFEAEKNTAWQTWDSAYKYAWSAVGYFFAKKLATDLNVTVGVIGCNWGGTSASAWMRREYLEVDQELNTYLTEQAEATKGKSIEQQCQEYDNYEIEQAEWQKKCDMLYAKNPNIEWAEVEEILGKCKWPGPKSCKNPYRPTGLYDCMLSRIIPYTIKGVLWYQGESDDHKPLMYAKLFSAMIDNWRTDWQDNTLPFVFVQLVNHRYRQDKDFKHWCLVREAQEKVHNTIKNAWMSVGFDLGMYNDIHPKSKKPLAERLEANALYNVYSKGDKLQAFSPMFKEVLPSENNTLLLYFENAEDGFVYKSDDKTFEYYKQMEQRQNTPVPSDFTGFEIAGADGIFYPAEYKLGTKFGKNTIELSSSSVKNPVQARYGWYNYGPVTIFSKNGLPLAPFRTQIQDFDNTTEHAEIQQIMTV